jgi:hypothetical protein
MRLASNNKVKISFFAKMNVEDISYEWGGPSSKIKSVKITGSNGSDTLTITFSVNYSKLTVSYSTYDHNGDYVFTDTQTKLFITETDLENVCREMWRECMFALA